MVIGAGGARARARFVAASLAVLVLPACNSGPAVEETGEAAPAIVLPVPEANVRLAADWPTYNGDLSGTRYSPLAQIHVDNVANLTLAWSYDLGRNTLTDSTFGGSNFTPLIVAGTMYVATANRVVALQADSGAEMWRHTVALGPPSRRSLAYWPGDRDTDARIFFTSDRRLVALNARTGRIAAAFGVRGQIDMTVAYDSAPVVYRDLLIVGSDTAPGSVRAFDARSGAERWVFFSASGAGSGEPSEYRNGPDHGSRDGGPLHGPLHRAWSMTVDVDRALLYAVFAGPGPGTHYGGRRSGDDFHSGAVVALDVHAGQPLWHFQTVRHDVWDYGLRAPPGLLDVRVGEQTVPALALPASSGHLYVLNRVNGDPVFPVEYRPVPQSDVPGERSAILQPFPVVTPPLARTHYTSADLVTAEQTSQEHAQLCRELSDAGGGAINHGPFTPYRLRSADGQAAATVVFPGSLGGAGWGGTASDPRLGYLFVNTTSEGALGWLEADGEVSADGGPGYTRRSPGPEPLARFARNSTGSDHDGALAWPCQTPPWGELIAVNVRNGGIAWRVPLGITRELPEDRQETGRPNIGGPIVTAGGLVFIGAANDRRFRAFAARTGVELWTTELRMSAHAVPVTYRGRDGKQYVAITAAGAGSLNEPLAPDARQSLLAFSLP